MNVKILVYPLEKVGTNDKGLTYAFNQSNKSEGMLAAFRYAGSINGKHFHKGLSAEKNPELLILLSGSAKLYGEDLYSGAFNEWELEQPSAVYIYPWVWHELMAHTDCHFVEFNSLRGHQTDTFYERP